MVKVAAAALLATASASTLAITFQDCGGAKAKVSDVSPKSIETGSTSAVVGTGDLSEDVTGASFDTTIKASGVTVASCNGDASKDVVCKLPLGVGAITLKATTFPLKAGTVKINTEVQLSSLVPASLASTDIHIEGTADSGDKLVCLDLHTQKQATATGDCSSAACPDVCTCATTTCAAQTNACLADANCAQKQQCAFGCACGDLDCLSACVGADDLAGAVLGCIKASCTGGFTV